MEDTQGLMSHSGGTDDETRRHNDLRKDILTSLLEVDQTIKGLEHQLVGKIQQIEETLRSAPHPGTPPVSDSVPRCEFNPADTTAWALRILQDNLIPISSGIASVQDTLHTLREGHGSQASPEGLAGLLSEIMALKDSIRNLREDRAYQDGLAGIVSEITSLREAIRSLGEDRETGQVLTHLAAQLGSLKESVQGLREERGGQEILAALSADLSDLKDSVRGLEEERGSREGMAGILSETASLKDLVAGLRQELDSMRDTIAGLKDFVAPLREVSARTADSTGAISQSLASLREETKTLPGALRSLRDEVATDLRRHGEEQTALLEALGAASRRALEEQSSLLEKQSSLLREIGGKILEEMSLLGVEARRSAASLPESEARLIQHLEAVGAAQDTGLQALATIRQTVEQNQAIPKTLSRIQKVVEQSDVALRVIHDSNQQVVRSFEVYHEAARQETERIHHRSAQEQNNRGVILYYRGAPEAAEQAFRKALEAEPDNAEAWNNLGLALSRQGKGDEAVATFQKAIELDPKMGEVYNNLGFLYHTTLKYDRALEMFNQAIQTTSDSAVAYTNLGNTYYKLNRHEQAVLAWKRALELDPLNENARRCLRMYQQESK